MRRIYLAALSQGAASLSALPLDEFEGLLVLFGLDARQATPTQPVLVVYGRGDQRFDSTSIEAHAERWRSEGADVQLSAIDGDHFALVKRRREVRGVVRGWLSARLDAR